MANLIRKTKCGFTLLELLLALTAATVLATLSALACQAVQKKSRSLQCLTRLQGLSQAIVLYTSDHRGAFPKSMHSSHSWAKAIAPYLDMPSLAAASQYRLLDPFTCPQHAIDKPTQRGWSYGLNVFFELNGQRRYAPNGLPIMSRDNYEGMPATWHRLTDIKHPSRTILLAENNLPAAGADHFMAHQWQTTATANHTVASQRHGEGSWYAFADGHVEWLPVEKTFDPASGVNLWHPLHAR